MNSFHQAISLAQETIGSFPKAQNGFPFLSLPDDTRVFFNTFIRKYGLLGNDCKYTPADILRRIRYVECFDTLLKNYILREDLHDRIILKTRFFTIVILKIGKIPKQRHELLSFFHHL